MLRKCEEEQMGDWRKWEKSVMLSTSSDAMAMSSQYFRCAQLPTGLGLRSSGRPSRPHSISNERSVGLALLLDDI
jgi:hypothetical protein